MQDQECGNQTSAMYSHVILNGWKEMFKPYREIEIHAPKSSRDFWRCILCDPSTSDESIFHLLYCDSKKTLTYINEKSKVEFGHFRGRALGLETLGLETEFYTKINNCSYNHIPNLCKNYIDWIASANYKAVSEAALRCHPWDEVYEVDTKVAITELIAFKRQVSQSDPAFKECEDLVEGINAGWFPVGYYSEYFQSTYQDVNGVTKDVPTHFGWVPRKQVIEAWAATKKASEIITAYIQTEQTT